MFSVLRIPADEELYATATDFLACSVSGRSSSDGSDISTSHAARQQSTSAFYTALKRNRIEPKNAEHALEIAWALCEYAERS